MIQIRGLVVKNFGQAFGVSIGTGYGSIRRYHLTFEYDTGTHTVGLSVGIRRNGILCHVAPNAIIIAGTVVPALVIVLVVIQNIRQEYRVPAVIFVVCVVDFAISGKKRITEIILQVGDANA